ncbi:MAG: orotate phosphoribosyltransferase [Microscillaceae bacterium]|nr:orotate phosphoribosyltransferase [Microscillaceae bacterium]MDW8459943.1 orotate phosphoribosyltransferase [Cytophagales bacterium]
MTQEERQVAMQVAHYLLAIQAVQFRFEPPAFKWSSGWNSPIYCDVRQTLSFPEIRSFLKKNLVSLIQSKFSKVSMIAGVATAGIPQGVLVADSLNLPFVYVRSKPKEHGKENLVEGSLFPDAQIVVVEDVISTGRSSLQAAESLRHSEPSVRVLGIVAVFNYGFDIAMRAFQEAGILVESLCNYNTLLIEVQKRYDLSEKTMASLHEWRNSPETWCLESPIL